MIARLLSWLSPAPVAHREAVCQSLKNLPRLEPDRHQLGKPRTVEDWMRKWARSS